MKGYLTHNDAYDAVVIVGDDDKIICAAQINTEIFIDFHSKYSNFEDWKFGDPFILVYADDDSVFDFGNVYAIRPDNESIIIADEKVYLDRREYYLRYERHIDE